MTNYEKKLIDNGLATLSEHGFLASVITGISATAPEGGVDVIQEIQRAQMDGRPIDFSLTFYEDIESSDNTDDEGSYEFIPKMVDITELTDFVEIRPLDSKSKPDSVNNDLLDNPEEERTGTLVASNEVT